MKQAAVLAVHACVPVWWAYLAETHGQVVVLQVLGGPETEIESIHNENILARYRTKGAGVSSIMPPSVVPDHSLAVAQGILAQLGGHYVDRGLVDRHTLCLHQTWCRSSLLSSNKNSQQLIMNPFPYLLSNHRTGGNNLDQGIEAGCDGAATE
jgi:hypothetical protein